MWEIYINSEIYVLTCSNKGCRNIFPVEAIFKQIMEILSSVMF